jgi:hypothetical protein
MATQPSPWQRFKDNFIRAAIHSPLGGGGLARAYFKHQGYSDEQINTAIKAYDTDFDKKYAKAPSFQNVRKGHPLDYVSPDNIGRGAVTLLGTVLGGVDPTYAIAPGATAAERIPAQAAVQGVSSVGRQKVNVNTGMQDKIHPEEVLSDMATGAVFQGGMEAVGKAVRGRIKPPETLSDEHIAPDGQPNGNAGGVRPMDPKEIATIMNDPAAAGGPPLQRRVNNRDQIIPEDVLNDLPPANREFLDATAPKPEVNDSYGDVPYEAPPPPANDVPSSSDLELQSRLDTPENKAEAQKIWNETHQAEMDKFRAPDDYQSASMRQQGDSGNKYHMTSDDFQGAIDKADEAVQNFYQKKLDDLAAPADGVSPTPIDPVEAPQGPVTEGRVHGSFEEHPTDNPDGNKYLTYTTKDGNKLPIKMGIEPDGTAEIAIDQFGNGANKLGPREIREAMYSLMDMYPEIKRFGGYRRSGAGKGRVQEIEPAPRVPQEDVRPSVDEVLTPAEKQDMDASAPKPVVDNTGYEAHTPYVGEPKVPANDVEAVSLQDKAPKKGETFPEFLRRLMKDERGSLGYRDSKGKPSIDDIPEEDLTPEQRLIKAIKQASPLRAEQEALYTQERAKRFAAARNVRNYLGGEAGYHVELSKLQGEMPTVPSLASISNHLSQAEKNALYDTITHHPRLDYTDTLKARSGLAKLLGNSGVTIPTNAELDALKKVFPELSESLNKRSLSSWVADALNLPRSIMASTDLSAALRQGLPLIHKKEYWSAFASMFKQLGPKNFDAVKEEIASRPTFSLMEDSGLALTDIKGRLADREERFMSNLAEAIPVLGAVVRASDRAYVGFLNKLRADTFDSLVYNARAAGKALSDKDLKDISKFINTATGRGDLNALVPKFLKGEEFDMNKASPLLSGGFFSPRLMASRVAMLNPVYYVRLNPIARKEALKSLMAYTTVVTTVLGIAKTAGLDVDTDPRSTDFAKIRDGNTRYDITAGFQPYVRTAAQLMSGQKVNSDGEVSDLTTGKFGAPNRADVVGSFLKNKEAPVVSFAHDLLTGKDRDGNELNVKNPQNIGSDVGKMFVPLVAQDMFDLYNDQGAKGVAKGLGPSVFGVSVQTYKPKPPKGKSEFGGEFNSNAFGKDEFGKEF